MSDSRLAQRLEDVAIRLRRVRRQRSLALGWILAAIATAVLIAGGLVESSWLPVLLLPLVVLTGRCGDPGGMAMTPPPQPGSSKNDIPISTQSC